ncbi:hypothetical protein ACFSL4_15570 [Streptomyces caeni]|uniref:Uncharacterized protein n=1 Tax=Streptomyces caeni TaxID=2307231 RepID=A0ABW4IQG3_9ACTN
MISRLGPLLLASGVGLALTATLLWAFAARASRLTVTARKLTWGALGSAAATMLAMEWALVTNDFSVRYVAEHSAREVPL